MTPKMPKTHDFGFGELAEVSYLETVFGLTRRTAMKYLEALRIKPIYIGKEVFFSLPTLRRILFVLSKPGSDGFVFPASDKKRSTRFRKKQDAPVVVTDEMLEQAADPKTLVEMAGCSGRNDAILKQFMKNKVGRPKEKQDE